jgi:DNA-binding CsgD family transcriptional regulator/tetratricopeptide (TPR) repeat protein
MAGKRPLVGRQAELERLDEALDGARLGHGSLVLLAGEAGVGKTRLAEELADRSGAAVLWGRASQSAPSPYGPIVASLRAHLRARPDGFDGCGALMPHLALLLPELGEPAKATDRATLFEAMRCALERAAGGEEPLVVVLDDLQWSDDATLELLPALAESLADLPVLVVAAYRSDGLPRDHLLRHVRHELHRGGRLDEIALGPLGPSETANLLEAILGSVPAPSLTRAIHDRTLGVAFLVEEFALALLLTNSLFAGRKGLELATGEVPVPDTVRDAVLIRASELSPEGRSAAEAAAVAGEEFELDLLAKVSRPDGMAELLNSGMIIERDVGRAKFRHALTREALYADVPWLRRRSLHRRLAAELEAAGATGMELATHWLGARHEREARDALLLAAEESRAVHAYRDAARAGRQALELWPEGEDEPRRVEALESYANSAELGGELSEAARAWREICALRQAEPGAGAVYAAAQSRLAAVLDMRGDREAALAARAAAAQCYATDGRHAEAAVERLAMANYLRFAARHSEAIELARAAVLDAKRAERPDLRARALGLEGVAEAKRGEYEKGLRIVRTGLTLAVEHDLTPAAAELYQRLSVVLYDSADYRRAQKTLDSALELCRRTDEPDTELACVTCMIYVLRECGEWAEALRLGQELIDARTAAWFAEGLLGVIHAAQGKVSSARRMLSSSLAGATTAGHYNMTVDTTAGLAHLAAIQGDFEAAAEGCRSLLTLWESSEDHHYAISGLRFGAGFFSRQGDLAHAHACVEALAQISSETGHGDALAALASAIGETALASGDGETAAERLAHAVELHRTLDVPYERAQIELRAGVALAASGEKELALERLGDAYRTAKKLGARPLAGEAARQVAELGESVVERLGVRATGDADGAGLSRRELEVVRHVAAGRTNREIAQELFLSPRTVDMHVRNVLRKLDCRSRVEAAQRAGELGLLEPS